MASSAQRGVAFSLAVELKTSDKTAITQQQRRQIFEYMKSQLPLFEKHLHLVEGISYFSVLNIGKSQKGSIQLELFVIDQEDLRNFFTFAKSVEKDHQNGLSHCLTSFFNTLGMGLECDFPSTTIVVFNVIMSDKKRKKISSELLKNESSYAGEEAEKNKTAVRENNEKVSGRHAEEFDVESPHLKSVRTAVQEIEQANIRRSATTSDEYEMHSGIWNTFMIDVPDKEVISVHIKCNTVKELNREIFRHSSCIYKIDIELPADYDTNALYWYKITLKNSVMWFFKSTKEIDTVEFRIGEKRVHQDILDSLSSILLHLQDIVKNLSDCYNESELCMQIEDLCSKLYYTDIEGIIKGLLQSDIMHSSNRLVRFAFVAGFLCRKFSSKLYQLINANTAHDILDALLQKKLENYPVSCLDYMPSLCHHLVHIEYGKDFCTLLVLSRASPFLSDKSLLTLVQENILKSEKFVNDKLYCYELSDSLCSQFLRNYLQTESIHSKEILEKLYRHLPLEIALSCFKKLNLPSETKERMESEEDIQTAITACIKSQILAFLSKTVKEKSIVQLLKVATAISQYEFYKDEKIHCSVEEGILSCFSFYSLQEEVTKQDFEDFLNLTVCFRDLKSQLQLLKSMSESKNSSVRRLFLVLNEGDFLSQAYDCAQSDVFTALLQNEIKTKQMRNGDEILSTFHTYCNILKLPVVLKRKEVQEALENEVSKWLNSYTLRELMLHIDKVEQLCEKEPAVSLLYKKHVHRHFQKKGVKPSEMLLIWCTNGSLRVNTKTTADIVGAIIDFFFGETLQNDDFEMFSSQIQHVDFWKLIENGEGVRINLVHDNGTYQRVKACIYQVTHLINTHEASVAFVKKINIKEENVKKILELGGMTKKDIKAVYTTFKRTLEETLQNIRKVKEVLEEIQNRSENKSVPDFFVIKQRVEEVGAVLENGSLSVRDIMMPEQLWGDLAQLEPICSALHPVIKSAVFWNVSKKVVIDTFENCLKNATLLDGLLSVRYLFDFETLSYTEQEEENLFVLDLQNKKRVIKYLKILKEKGISLFEEKWKTLEMDSSVQMQVIQEMFEKAKVSEEIRIADQVLARPIRRTLTETLTQLSRKNELLEKANAMTSLLESLGYNISTDSKLHSALQSFQELVKQKISSYTLQDIQIALKTIFQLVDRFTDISVFIMSEIGKASLLIEFLREIAIEDVRNLIDAVEDISESHVQESTVSALIEVKRFLQPILSVHLEEKNGQWIFETLQKQISALGKNADSIPGKVSDCCLHLHNLKSLYNNVANRGQQTKEIIRSIITKGKFVFMLSSEQDKVLFEISYKENKTRFTKQESTIIDIRSRALLLLNTERQCAESSYNQEDFRVFVDYIDLCLEIRETLRELYASGHMKYKSLKLSLKSVELLTTKDRLSSELDEWMENLYSARNKYFLMNFLQGCQIRLLSDFLENGSSRGMIEAILKFIHPHFSAQRLAETFKEDMILINECSMLEELGRSLHEMYAQVNFYYRDMVFEETSTKMTDCVHKGQLFVAQLDENSEFVIRTILALYRNTTRHFPEPNQLLFCTTNTTWYEIELLLERCIGSLSFYKSLPLYCLANVEVLPNEVQFKLVEELRKLRKYNDYLLAVICRGSKNHPFVDQLNDCLVTVQPVSKKAIQTLFKAQCPRVITYTSEVAGLGKTTNICHRAMSADRSTVTLHISGQMRKDSLIADLNALKIRDYHTLHLDIGSIDEPSELDTFVFELVVMKFIASGKLAFYLPTDNICFEIANTINNTLRNSLTTATSFQREHLIWNDFSDFTCSKEVNSAVQVVCHYLASLDNGLLDREELHFSGKKHLKPLQKEQCRLLLNKHLNISTDISFTMVHIFLNVLSDQLKKFSCSPFFKVSHISEMIGQSTVPTVRSSLVKAMIDVSVEFASRSVNACRSTQNTTVVGNESQLEQKKQPGDMVAKIVQRTDGMIRWEESNHLIYVFHNQNIHTLSPMYRDRKRVPDHVQKLFESQMKRTLPDFGSMQQIELQNILQRVARTKPTLLNEKQLNKLSKDYALTPDNLLKMVLIMMRVQSRVPVVIMGETGCGKTSLIRYLASICEVPFEVLNIHAGIKMSDITDVVMQEDAKCRKVRKQRWLFLDEINTSENLGIISDIICHHRCNGFLLSTYLVIMGACNPYKLRTVEEIHTAGLTGKVKTDELSKLVYRVLPLPEMMVDYVWDFGSLSEKDETKYISRMVEGIFSIDSLEHALLSDLLSISQIFVREIESSACVVSLRDVQRCRTLVPWFSTILKKKPLMKHSWQKIPIEIKAIILSLAHCYHSRFLSKSVRARYRQKLLEGFKRSNCSIISKEEDLLNIIKEEQKDILNRMVLPAGTAKNIALQENIFVILVCILNRIPIFVVGKPGCSKSLAMQIIRSNLRGKDSSDDFFKTLPQLYCVSFQGSESSTSDGIVKVFEKAENYQKSNSQDAVLSVVILDEIGLAEISRFNPLKVLHNLLEPDGQSRPNIAVVGISNWALDGSKMNRAIHLSRPDMDQEELFETAISIGKSFVDSVEVNEGLSWNEEKISLSSEDLEQELQLVAHAYTTYTKQLQFKHFHGLRDFYSLVKFIARTLAKEGKNLTSQRKSDVVIEGLRRNFGGLKSGLNVLLEHFKVCFKSNLLIQFSAVDLVKSNIEDTMARHLMVITKGESVLGILEQSLRESGRERKEIIFGSQFAEDLTDDYNYRILSRIILCMEQGIVLVLKDLENIYGSLYDMLNQNYTRIGKKNNCRIALGPYSNPFCHVADTFRCIVLVDENKVDYTDPPFLNRFEKQFLSFSDIITPKESELVEELKKWLDNLTSIEGKPFSKYSALPFYNEELIVSLLLYFKRNFKQLSDRDLLGKCEGELMWLLRPEVIVRLSHVDSDVVKLSSNDIKESFFRMPLHDGLENFIEYQIGNVEEESFEQMTVVFTYSNIHVKLGNQLKDFSLQSEKLGAFKSEKQLSLKLQQFWNSKDMQILLVHCNSQEDDRHIMLTKSLIEKYRAEYLHKRKEQCLKLAYLIVHFGCRDFSQDFQEFPQSFSQINYLSGWKLVLLENLECPQSSLPDICSKSLQETVENMLSTSDCLKEELFWAFTRIQYGSYGRDVESIRNILEKIQKSESFLRILSEMILVFVQEKNTGEDNSDWFVNVASDTQALNISASLIDALGQHMRTLIKNPLAMIIFKLEHIGALDSFFVEDKFTNERREVWCAQLKNECVFSYSIKGKPIKEASGPECYHCDTPDLGLKLPFSRIIYECIEDTKDLFTEEVTRSKIKCDLEPDDNLPEEVMNEIILQQESFIFKNIADILDACDMYECLEREYINDFCNLYSYTFTSAFGCISRTEYMQWLLEQKVSLHHTDKIQLFTQIHCAGWSHLPLFGSAMLLLELSADVFSRENTNIIEQFEHARCESGLLNCQEIVAFADQTLENQNAEGETESNTLEKTGLSDEKTMQKAVETFSIYEQTSQTSFSVELDDNEKNEVYQESVYKFQDNSDSKIESSENSENAQENCAMGGNASIKQPGEENINESANDPDTVTLNHKQYGSCTSDLTFADQTLENQNAEGETESNTLEKTGLSDEKTMQKAVETLSIYEQTSQTSFSVELDDNEKNEVYQESVYKFQDNSDSKIESSENSENAQENSAMGGNASIKQPGEENINESANDPDTVTLNHKQYGSCTSDLTNNILKEEKILSTLQTTMMQNVENVDRDKVVIASKNLRSASVQNDTGDTFKGVQNKLLTETYTPPTDKKNMTLEWSEDKMQDLVSFICTKMIPTAKTLLQFSNITEWQVCVRNVLTLAAEVSTDSKVLHTLRLCNDIVSDLIIPYKLDLELLMSIGNSLIKENIDSCIVFSNLMSMFQHAKDTGLSFHIQRVLCQYLIRCLSSKPDTTAYTYLFKAIETGVIPEEEMELLKLPLNFLVQQMLFENENMWKQVIANGIDLNEKENDSDNNEDIFLQSLHRCLSNLTLQGKVGCPFVLLIVDMLQESFETDEEQDSSYELMLQCGKKLHDFEIGLPFVISVAYLKAAVSYLTDIMSNSDSAKVSDLLTRLNAVLSGIEDVGVQKSLLGFFLKGLGRNSATINVIKYCKKISSEYSFVNTIEWTDNYLSKTMEGNTLMLNVPAEMLMEGEAYLAEQQTTESFKTGVEKLMNFASKESKHGLVLLYSLTMKDFYLSRYRKILDDTTTCHAEIIWEVFQKQSFSSSQQKLMECLLGKCDFICSHFMHGEESSFQQYMINSVLISTFALVLGFCKETSGQSLPFLTGCLMKPLLFKSCFLPDFPDKIKPAVNKDLTKGDSVFAKCECGKRLVFRIYESTLVCVVCRREIHKEKLKFQMNVNRPHFDQSTLGLKEPFPSSKNLSDISLNILQLLVKGCLLGSIALGLSKEPEVEKLIPDHLSENNVTDHLETEINEHWEKMKDLLNMDDHDVGILCHTVLNQGRMILFEEKYDIVTPSFRGHFEKMFDNLVNSILESRSQMIHTTITRCNNIYNVADDAIEVVIREANELQCQSEQSHYEQMQILFRLPARPTKADFLCQFFPLKETYTFLNVFLKHENQLSLLKHIYQILQWHMSSVVNTGYLLKRHDCLKLTVFEFYDTLRDMKKRKMIKKKFEDFRQSWNILTKELKATDGFENLLPVDTSTKMTDCLILDAECDIYRVLDYLVDIQNNFIDQALQLAFDCRNLQYLLRSNDAACFKVVPVAELKRENLIQASFEWDEVLAQESNSGLQYGQGKRIRYDFHNIEKEIAVDLLRCKAYINFEALPNIVFTDELYRNFVSLLSDVCSAVPQEVLPSDVEVAFVKSSGDMANMPSELLHFLDMILTILKKTKYDPNKTLVEFVKERSSILGQKFPQQYLPSPESRIKISHVVSLHELLEELCVDRILGTLSKAYNTEMESDLQEHFLNMPVASLRKAELVCKTLKKFIYRCIVMGDMDPEHPLQGFLCQESFWPLNSYTGGKLKVDGKEEDVREIIPSYMLVCHAAAAVTQLSESIETQKQGELRMDSVITSWKSKSEGPSKATRQKKALKKLRKS